MEILLASEYFWWISSGILFALELILGAFIFMGLAFSSLVLGVLQLFFPQTNWGLSLFLWSAFSFVFIFILRKFLILKEGQDINKY